MAIRNGQLNYDDILKEVEIKMKTLEELYKTSNLQDGVDIQKIETLFKEVVA